MGGIEDYETDVIPTTAGDLAVTCLGHGSLLFTWQGQRIYVDPHGRVADYRALPKADLVLITHEHSDHLDPQALAAVRTASTRIVASELAQAQIGAGTVMRNGDKATVGGLPIHAVPAYNLLHKRENGQPFHPKGVGNGYVLEFGDLRVYVAGDTEDVPDMSDLGAIDVAFLPANLPYTMSIDMVVEAARKVRPPIVYPYHFGKTDTAALKRRLESEVGCEARIRRLA